MLFRPTTDLCVNSFERTYREVFAPGFFLAIEEQSQTQFTSRIALINNVGNRADAVSRAELALKRGEITAYYFVADHLDEALCAAGLRIQCLGRTRHFSDYAFVALHLAKSDFLVSWDAEVSMQSPCDWIGPGVALLINNPVVLVVNPQWDPAGVEKESRFIEGDFAYGYGFSDQLFLTDPRRLQRSHSSAFCPISLRYPLEHIKPIFESRVDRFMRRSRLLRATYLPARYFHPVEQGGSYPPATFVDKTILHRNRIIVKILKKFKLKSPCLGI